MKRNRRRVDGSSTWLRLGALSTGGGGGWRRFQDYYRSAPPWSVVMLVTRPWRTQRLVLVVPTPADSVPRSLDYGAILGSDSRDYLPGQFLVVQRPSSSFPIDCISSNSYFKPAVKQTGDDELWQCIRYLGRPTYLSADLGVLPRFFYLSIYLLFALYLLRLLNGTHRNIFRWVPIGHPFGSKWIWKRMSEIWGIPSPANRASQPPFSTTSKFIGNFNAIYFRNETRYT